ncbi:MAG: molecular chaperone HtpG [Mucinivorans sp.]
METKGNIGVTTENIFPIIKKFLYSDHEIFLRELVSNGVDACTKLKTLSSMGEYGEPLGELKVSIKVDSDKKTLTISDNGVGMTGEQIEKYINQIAFSGAEEFMAKYENQTGIIGHFGLGFYSAFMVAQKVEIHTKSCEAGSQAMRWECDGTPEYLLEATEKTDRGTDIILHLSEESVEFSTVERIGALLRKYCSFLPVAIEFDGHQINDTKPLWMEKPADITSEQYAEFYRKLYPMAEEPLFHIHLNVDYPFNLTGVLYFPRLKNNIEIQKNKIQLYCNQVFVTDSVEGIVPEFLTLLHGVIDSPDIPLNVSRSYLQSDSNVKKISGYITRKVADRLADIFKAERTEYEQKWDDLKIFIQYGIVSDEKFAERAPEFTLFKDTMGKYHTFEEYTELIKEKQTDKNKKLVHIYTNDPVVQHSFIEDAKTKGYNVLVMDSPLEAHFISWAENKYPDWSFVRVDSAPLEQLVETDNKSQMSLSSAQHSLLTPVFQGVLPTGKEANYTVEFAALGQDGQPAIVTQNEFMRRMKDMSRVGGGGMNFYGQMPDSYTVVINDNNPLVADVLGQVEKATQDSLPEIDKELSKAKEHQHTIQEMVKGKKEDEIGAEEKDERTKANAEVAQAETRRRELLERVGRENAFTAQIVDLALLSAGLLKGEKLTEFVRRSANMIK